MHRFAALGLVLLVAGCSSHGTGTGTLPDAAPALDADDFPHQDAGGLPVFQDCRGGTFVAAPKQDWRHGTLTPIVTAAGAANHAAQDVIVPPGATTSLPGKFSYGTISKDLEDEDVRVSVWNCTRWLELGTFATNSDGRIAASFEAPGPGVYETRFQVMGDTSTTTSFIWVLPTGTRIVVSDIDGTLTASDSELFQQVFDGTHLPVAYPSAVELTTSHRARGWVVLYLTGRPYWLTQKSRDWLSTFTFTPGPLHVTDSNGEALPTEGGVGDFKKSYLAGLRAAGYELDLAYGNATTDIYAYLGASFSADDVWIIGKNAGQQSTHPVADSWATRVGEVQALPAVTQPFAW